MVVATSASCDAADADAGGRRRGRRRPTRGGATPAAERAAAAVPGRGVDARPPRRLAALECFEAGKPWDQADADVCEAIDFCEYYGREVLRLDRRRRPVQSPPGEAQPPDLPGQGRRGGHRAVELPARHPLRDDRGGAGGRQPRDPEAGRADPGRRVAAGRGAAGRAAPRRACSSSFPAWARTSAPRSSSTPTSPSSPSPGRRPSGSAINRAGRGRDARRSAT